MPASGSSMSRTTTSRATDANSLAGSHPSALSSSVGGSVLVDGGFEQGFQKAARGLRESASTRPNLPSQHRRFCRGPTRSKYHPCVSDAPRRGGSSRRPRAAARARSAGNSRWRCLRHTPPRRSSLATRARWLVERQSSRAVRRRVSDPFRCHRIVEDHVADAALLRRERSRRDVDHGLFCWCHIRRS